MSCGIDATVGVQVETRGHVSNKLSVEGEKRLRLLFSGDVGRGGFLQTDHWMGKTTQVPQGLGETLKPNLKSGNRNGNE